MYRRFTSQLLIAIVFCHLCSFPSLNISAQVKPAPGSDLESLPDGNYHIFVSFDERIFPGGDTTGTVTKKGKMLEGGVVMRGKSIDPTVPLHIVTACVKGQLNGDTLYNERAFKPGVVSKGIVGILTNVDFMKPVFRSLKDNEIESSTIPACAPFHKLFDALEAIETAAEDIVAFDAVTVPAAREAAGISIVRENYVKIARLAANEIYKEYVDEKISLDQATGKAADLRNEVIEYQRSKSSDLPRAIAIAKNPAGKTRGQVETEKAKSLFKKPFKTLSAAQKDKVWTDIIKSAGQLDLKGAVTTAKWGAFGKALLIATIAISVYQAINTADKLNAMGGTPLTAGGNISGGKVAGMIALFMREEKVEVGLAGFVGGILVWYGIEVRWNLFRDWVRAKSVSDDPLSSSTIRACSTSTLPVILNITGRRGLAYEPSGAICRFSR